MGSADHRPYERLTAAAAALGPTRLKRETAPSRPDASRGLPPAPRDPLGHFEPTLALKGWDREREFVRPSSEFPLADLYACWDRTAVYLGLFAQDVVEDSFHRDKLVRAPDRAQWIVSVNGASKTIRARLGAGLEPIVDEPAARIVNLSGINGNFRNVAALVLPAKLFGRDRFKSGDAIELDSTFLGHCGAYSVEWRGRFVLSGRQ